MTSDSDCGRGLRRGGGGARDHSAVRFQCFYGARRVPVIRWIRYCWIQSPGTVVEAKKLLPLALKALLE